MKPGAVLINCGRGGLLDLDAAYAALLDGRLAGVGLDVFDPEPPADHPLFRHADVVLTPHVMALSRRARALVFEEMAAAWTTSCPAAAPRSSPTPTSTHLRGIRRRRPMKFPEAASPRIGDVPVRPGPPACR